MVMMILMSEENTLSSLNTYDESEDIDKSEQKTCLKTYILEKFQVE